MTQHSTVKYYSPFEEKLNVLSHGFGALASVFALVFLIFKAIHYDDIWYLISFVIYGVCMFTLFLASTLYHSSTNDSQRSRLKVFDHAAIYLMIAGTYAPFCLVTLKGFTGWLLFGVTWCIALIGIILKLFFTGRFKKISTFAYILMGWLIIFAIKPLSENLSEEGLFWLIAGGLSFTIGAIIYVIPQIKFNHAIFHFCVLIGSFCHFTSIYFYV